LAFLVLRGFSEGQAMNQLSYYAHEFVYFFRDGIHEGFLHVNGALGLIIALVAAYVLSNWRKRIWAVALGATVAHLLAEVLIPVLDNRSPFELPRDMVEWSYWRVAIALYLGYLVVISIFYYVKKNVLPKGAGAPAHR
jgi:hypothetical protein